MCRGSSTVSSSQSPSSNEIDTSGITFLEDQGDGKRDVDLPGLGRTDDNPAVDDGLAEKVE